MNDNLKTTLKIFGCTVGVGAIIAPTAVSLTDPVLTGDTITNGLTSAGNSVYDSSKGGSESEGGSDTTSAVVVTSSIGGGTTETFSPEPDTIIRVKNDVEYDLLEKRANKIYDKYHKNHIPSDKRGKGFIFADNPDTAYICNEMVYKTFGSQESLISNIETLLSVVSDVIDNEILSIEEKVRLQKVKELLIELNAVYTEKKIITLSTKDNETLQFILNEFKKHKEVNKNKIKSLKK